MLHLEINIEDEVVDDMIYQYGHEEAVMRIITMIKCDVDNQINHKLEQYFSACNIPRH